MKIQEKQGKVLNFFLYTCGFLLLWEWLRPLKELTDTANMSVFIFFLCLAFTLAYLNVHFFIRTGLKLLYVFYTLNFLYFEGSFFRFRWLIFLFQDVRENMSIVFQGDWMKLSDSFRSLLFFLLLALMAYLLHYWLIQRKQIFVFFFMTLVFITVLDTFTPYEAKGAIVRSVMIGFVVMGILTFFRLLEKERVQTQAGFVKKWMAPLLVMTCFSVLIGYSVPKASPIWPDPVPYIKSYSQGSGTDGSGGEKKVGYGIDDSKLGGPFKADNTIVYETEVDSRQYWKVETKDVYTGKGWISSVEEGERVSFDQNENFPIASYTNPNIKTEDRTAIIKPVVNYPHLIYPLGLRSVQNDSQNTFEVDLSLEKIYTSNPIDGPGIKEYSVEYANPKFSVKSMMSIVDNQHPELTGEFLERYTQLPEELPQRVKDLALELTKDKTNWYDKAKTIENYFDGPQFQYDQKDVAVPSRNEDYVDQFLFETHKGYCDNFSTSMLVMVRSLGIPARWVKGYTQGDFRGLGDSGKRLYVVTNNNAHSWVEVYFPNIGWVPFEPTKGFANNIQFAYDQVSQNTGTDVQQTPQAPKVEMPKDEKKTASAKKSSFSWKETWSNAKDFLNKYWYLFIFALLVIGFVIYGLYRTRLKWLPCYYVYRFKRRRKDEDFPAAYFTLLNHLNRYGLTRKQGQTLRDYAEYVDRYFSSEEMGILTENYERYVYKGHLEKGTWEETRELWENLIKKTIA